ncbi:MAG: TIGR01212 family radical SAM protein [Eubacteriales bacterium]|nr:TIGR01212 family radical SAM protein [Eubacteriales bacterium]
METVENNDQSPRMWGEKPYRSLDWQLRKNFGEKVYKLALNGGMTCPNRDGKIGTGGCIFCSAGGSGDFAADKRLSVTEQIRTQKEALREKKPARKYIAYFQAYTNTYAPVDYLEKIFMEAMDDEEVVVLSVATRPDCLPEEILDLLERLNKIKPVWVELGLQTMHEDTAKFIRRGYSLKCFEHAVSELRKRGVEVIVHVILGLPGEDGKRILQTVEYLNNMDIQGIKLQLLHILEGTDLGKLYQAGSVPVMTMEEYIDTVIECLEHLSPQITVHRLTGDGPKDILLAPLWSSRKRTVLNMIHSRMKERGSFQGKQILWEES